LTNGNGLTNGEGIGGYSKIELKSKDNTTSGNNETNEESGFCPVEITEENEDLVEESCLAIFDEPEDSNSKVEELLSSWSFFASICVIAIIAFRRR